MNTENWLIRGTAWLAFALYVAAEAIGRQQFRADARLAQWLNSLGCAALLAHILWAFHLRHDWSHDAAYSDTARQTAALTGWNWGSGLYINYLFALVWVGEVVRSWRNRGSREARTGVRTWILRGFFLFMFLNAGVIFVRGPARWLGLACCLGLVAAWLLPCPADRPAAETSIRQAEKTKGRNQLV